MAVPALRNTWSSVGTLLLLPRRFLLDYARSGFVGADLQIVWLEAKAGLSSAELKVLKMVFDAKEEENTDNYFCLLHIQPQSPMQHHLEVKACKGMTVTL